VNAKHLLALDLGTTGVRALVVATDGRVLARAYRTLGVRVPAPGRVEQDPEEMWQSALQVLRTALADSALDPRDIAGLGVASQRSTVVAWDSETRRPLCAAISWQDQRTEDLVAVHRKRGLPINTLASATKYEWWLQHEPAVVEAAAAGRLRFGNPDAWLSDRLTAGAAFVTDPSQASCTGLYDLSRGCWSPALLSFFGVDGGTLPEIRATSEVVGETAEEFLGVPIPLAARAGDQQAASFAHGVFERGDAKLTLGTSAMLDVHTGDTPAAGDHAAIPMALWRLPAVGDAYCVEGQVLTAGAVVEWLVTLGIVSEPSDVDRVARQTETSDGVVFVPALQGLGTPWSDTAARGLIGGLTRGSNAAHLARAALEGIAQRCVDICDALGLDDRPLRVDGGLARSRLLLQNLADLGGRPLAPAVEAETTALGAAKLAGLAVGSFESPLDCLARGPEPAIIAPGIGASERLARRRRWRECVERAQG